MRLPTWDTDPAHIEAMRSAFQKVCEALQLNCGVDDRTTDLVVMKIVEIAKDGECDPDLVCKRVLHDLRS
jgi:hypothetical protein